MTVSRLAVVAIAALLAGPGIALAQQKEWKEVRIGTEGAYPPFNNLNAKGELEGFEIDYANMLCAKMNTFLPNSCLLRPLHSRISLPSQ